MLEPDVSAAIAKDGRAHLDPEGPPTKEVLRRLDVGSMVRQTPPSPPWVVEGLVVKGMVTGCAARRRGEEPARDGARRGEPATGQDEAGFTCHRGGVVIVTPRTARTKSTAASIPSSCPARASTSTKPRALTAHAPGRARGDSAAPPSGAAGARQLPHLVGGRRTTPTRCRPYLILCATLCAATRPGRAAAPRRPCARKPLPGLFGVRRQLRAWFHARATRTTRTARADTSSAGSARPARSRPRRWLTLWPRATGCSWTGPTLPGRRGG